MCSLSTTFVQRVGIWLWNMPKYWSFSGSTIAKIVIFFTNFDDFSDYIPIFQKLSRFLKEISIAVIKHFKDNSRYVTIIFIQNNKADFSLTNSK